MRILTNPIEPSDAVSWYRTFGPLTALGYDVRSAHLDTSWPDIRQCDLVFLQRPGNQFDRELMKMAADCGVPTVADFDDYLLQVPPFNSSYHHHANPRNREVVEWSLENADAVLVSTQPLAEMFAKHRRDCHVVPNAYDADAFPYAKTVQPREKFVLWRGTITHSGDILPVVDQIRYVLESKEGWSFVAMGQCPWFTMTNRAYFQGPLPFIEFQRKLYDLRPAIVVCPLADNPFNRCKSNIAWIEATHAGAVCLAPAWDEWKMPGAVNYTADETFGPMLRVAIAHHENGDLGEFVEESRSHISKHLTLERVNETRRKILENMA